MVIFFSMQKDFFRKLMDVFRLCEDVENIDGLHVIFKIVRGISKYLISTCPRVWFIVTLLLMAWSCILCVQSYSIMLRSLREYLGMS